MANCNTSQEFDIIISKCEHIFLSKMRDYGTSWRILRPSSLTDQIYIKANRIRSLQELGEQKVEEGILPEFIGIVNYAIMALIQLEIGTAEEAKMEENKCLTHYRFYAQHAKELMENKNHDYGEAWRNMRVSSIDDIILMKLLRVKQIENNEGRTEVSEGIDASYYDIINYAIFAMILMGEATTKN